MRELARAPIIYLLFAALSLDHISSNLENVSLMSQEQMIVSYLAVVRVEVEKDFVN